MDYLYDVAGDQISELSSIGAWNRGEVYADGRHLGTYINGTTYLIYSDHLGTVRIRTNCTRLANMPRSLELLLEMNSKRWLQTRSHTLQISGTSQAGNLRGMHDDSRGCPSR